MVKVGIIGATGYAGAELVRILLNHKEAQIEWFGSRSYIDENYADIYRKKVSTLLLYVQIHGDLLLMNN